MGHLQERDSCDTDIYVIQIHIKVFCERSRSFRSSTKMTGSRTHLPEYQGPVTYGGNQIPQGNQGDNYAPAFPERGITPIQTPQYFYASPATPGLYAQPMSPPYSPYATAPPVIPRGFDHALDGGLPPTAYGAREMVGWKIPEGQGKFVIENFDEYHTVDRCY